MRRLSIFSGAFSFAAACAIATDERIDRVRVVEDLASLVAKSLVSAEPRDSEVEYRQFATTRSYALEKLAANNELESTRRRRAGHVLALAARAEAECERLPMAEWLVRYGSRIDDVRDALRWACSDPAGASLAVRLAAKVRGEPNNLLYATPHVQAWFARLPELADGGVKVIRMAPLEALDR